MGIPVSLDILLGILFIYHIVHGCFFFQTLGFIDTEKI